MPPHTGLTGKFFKELVLVLFCVGNAFDSSLQDLSIRVILEGFDELIAMLLALERISNMVDQMIELLSDGLGSNGISVDDGTHDEDGEPCEQAAKSQIVGSCILTQIAKGALY